MELQKYVTEVIETLGGVVIPEEYALCQVLIPEEYKDYFQGQTEVELAFDFEVAEENPGAEFVTFGSYLLDQLLALADEKAQSTVRFVEIQRLELANPLKKIQAFMPEEPGKISILNERNVMGAWAAYQFNITFISDTKEESTREIWVDLLTNRVDPVIQEQQNRIVHQRDPLYTLPFAKAFDIQQGFESAFNDAIQKGEDEKKQRLQDETLQQDIDRIQEYYTELMEENEQRANRKGLTEEKKEDIHAKTKAIEIERDKQLQEIRNKYDVQIEPSLEHGILYMIPVIEYQLEMDFRGTQKEKTLYYNPITKGFALAE
ncbi:hypothetical protein [Natribacillus halophilus]|uniref:Uncharacterized protein n=1 Tax=Natribacillus halophilus TaxID=549003 RepID=A0A1G8N390_9BACI|nr:hypothetical protein [Natribacillus halophilus]SDI74664.1 hypothetical protein SAMN04488123_105181 [Natribacillus halophilus]